MDYAIDAARGIVRLRNNRIAPFPEWEETMERIRQDPGFRPGMPFLLDRRGNTEVPSPTQLELRVAYMRRALAGSRWAVVVTAAAEYGMARMASAIGRLGAGSVELEVFTDLGAAERWLVGGTEEELA